MGMMWWLTATGDISPCVQVGRSLRQVTLGLQVNVGLPVRKYLSSQLKVTEVFTVPNPNTDVKVSVP